jgi:hypothetical protein
LFNDKKTPKYFGVYYFGFRGNFQDIDIGFGSRVLFIGIGLVLVVFIVWIFSVFIGFECWFLVGVGLDFLKDIGLVAF